MARSVFYVAGSIIVSIGHSEHTTAFYLNGLLDYN